MECKFEKSEPEPKLRHEFVGMMFAVTIGEVGLQIAPLIRAGGWMHLLPAYSHLLLATVVIATSWMGWTLSVAPGARKDVGRIFQWEFLVLLLDVLLVILYFILVRAVDSEKSNIAPYIAPPLTVAHTLVWIFVFYVLWDILTKIIIFMRDVTKEEGNRWWNYYDKPWLKKYGSRMLPTLLCLILAVAMAYLFRKVDRPSYFLTADVAFLALMLLFRALKEVVSALWPSERKAADEEKKARKKWSVIAGVCFLFLVFASLWTWCSWPLPPQIVSEMNMVTPDAGHYSEGDSEKSFANPEWPMRGLVTFPPVISRNPRNG